MSRLKFGMAAFALMGLLAATCEAQQPGRGGRGGGFGGPGGGGNAGLLGMSEVRTELKVTDEQGGNIDKLLEESRGKMPNLDFQALQALSEEERQKKTDEFRAQVGVILKETDEKLAGILNADQMKRLGELRLQREGVGALTQPDVVAALGISEEQQKQIKDIQDAGMNQTGFDRQAFQNLSDEERQKLIAGSLARREKTAADMMAVLTDEQRAKLTEMKGAEFKFPERGFGGRNRGPRQRPPRSPGA